MKIKALSVAFAAAGLCASVHAQVQYIGVPLQAASAFAYGCAVEALSATGLSAGECMDGVHQVPSMWDAQGNQTLLATPTDALITWVTGINSSGQVSGYYADASFAMHAVRWDNGQPALLDHTGSSYSVANGINDTGDVVGALNNAVVWKQNGQLISLPPPADAGLDFPSSYGLAINAYGVVAGSVSYFTDGVGASGVAVWQRRKPALLTPAGQSGQSVPSALNAQGTVVGYFSDGSGAMSAWMWAPTGATPLPGLPGSQVTIASGINRANAVVGFSVGADGIYRGVKWIDGQLVQLDGISRVQNLGGNISDAKAINDHGWIAARYSVPMPPYTYSIILKPVR